MCLSGNNADHASEFINDQLASLWHIGSKCLHRYELEGKNPWETTGYDFALNAYYYHDTGKEISDGRSRVFIRPTKFTATFNQPTLEFACDHEAILRLHVNSAVWEGRWDGHDGQLDGPAIVAIRLPFTKSAVGKKSTVIGNGDSHDIVAYVLDVSKARFVQTADSAHGLQDWEPHFIRYLEFFRRAGHHVLYSLPDFDDDVSERKVDFTSAALRIYEHFPSILGVELATINKYIQESWLAHLWRVSKEINASKRGFDIARHNPGDFSLAEYSTKWALATHESGIHFKLKFGVPKFEVLCEHEAIVTLDIDEIRFTRHGAEDTESFTHWKIPVILKLVKWSSEDGSVETIGVDTSQGGIVFENPLYLHLPGREEGNEEHNDRLERLAEFLTTEYWQLLEISKVYLYRHDKRVTPPFGPQILPSPTEGEDSVHKLIEHTQMHAFEQVVALSRHSIDNVLYTHHSLLEELRKMSRDGVTANLGPLRVRILSNTSAIVWAHIVDGAVQIGKETHRIRDWKLAFEVPLEMVTVEKWEKQSVGFWGKRLIKTETTRQIILNFEKAEYLFPQSIFGKGSLEISRLSIDKVNAAVDFIQKAYFKFINSSPKNLNVAYSVVISNEPDKTRYSFSDVTFQIYSKFQVNLTNFNRLQATEEPVIVILGMVTAGKRIERPWLNYSSSWLTRSIDRYSYGTVALAASVFLRGRLLPILAEVNADTTLVPSKIDFYGGNWDIKLVTWANHPIKSKIPTRWIETTEKGSATFDFIWNNVDRFDYQHRNDSDEDHDVRHHYVNIKTSNTLSIPRTFRKGELDIRLKGETSVEVGWTGASEVSSKAVTSWGVVIAAITTENGLNVVTKRSVAPETKHFSGGLDSRLPEDLLQVTFPKDITPTKQVDKLKIFESTWHAIYPGIGKFHLANPFFNVHGDLLIDLVPKGAVFLAEDLPKAPVKATHLTRSVSGRYNGTPPRSPQSDIFKPLPPANGNGTNGNGKYISLKPTSKDGLFVVPEQTSTLVASKESLSPSTAVEIATASPL